MTNECFAILVSAPDFIEEGPLLHCTHCTKKLKKSLICSIPSQDEIEYSPQRYKVKCNEPAQGEKINIDKLEDYNLNQEIWER